LAKNFIPVSQLDFDFYKNSLKNYLKSQDRFKDYDFEGSNINVLLDLLTYNTFNNAHYLNMVGSEMFLDSAQLRESIVSHAKELNYTPRSRVSARAQVDIEITPADIPDAIVIPKYYAVKSTSSNAGNIKFVTNQAITITRNPQGRYVANNVTVYEGEVVTEKFTVVPTTSHDTYVTYNQRFNLQSPNVDISSIEVLVQADINSTPVEYERATSLIGLEPTSLIYFVRGYKDNYYEIEFGDGILGAALENGNIVTVIYRDTIGADGNGSYTFSKTTAIDGYNDISITTLSRASGGAEREANDEIKYNAVRHFEAQDRAVTESDYEILVKANFPEIQKVSVYGGERVFQYGKIFVVLKPYDINGFISDNTKKRIVDFLKTKNIVPEPIIVDPEYYYLNVVSKVYYNSNITMDQVPAIRTAASQALINLNNTALADFNTTVYQSTIVDTIKNAHDAIVGVSVKNNLIKRWSPQVGETSLTFTLDNRLYDCSEQDEYAISSSPFRTIYQDAIVTAIVRDDGKGNLVLFVADVNSGQMTKVPQVLGTVNYETGAVSLELSVTDYQGDYIEFVCLLEEQDIKIELNKYLVLDGADIDLTLININE